jgi:hypothetical protein
MYKIQRKIAAYQKLNEFNSVAQHGALPRVLNNAAANKTLYKLQETYKNRQSTPQKPSSKSRNSMVPMSTTSYRNASEIGMLDSTADKAEMQTVRKTSVRD